MPYITRKQKADLNENGVSASLSGELNYQITALLADYIRTKGLSYQAINDCLGALEGAKLEFYRRVAVPYEERKRTSNGDVY